MHITVPPYDNISNNSPEDHYTLLCIFPQLTPARGHKNDPNSQFHTAAHPTSASGLITVAHKFCMLQECAIQLGFDIGHNLSMGEPTNCTTNDEDNYRGGGGWITTARQGPGAAQGGLTQRRGETKDAGEQETSSGTVGIKIGTPMPNESNDELVL